MAAKTLTIDGKQVSASEGATLLQAAEEAGASILYSEDLATGQRYGALRVVNPLIEPATP